MIIDNKDLGLYCEVPDKLTVRQQLAYQSTIGLAMDGNLYETHWEACKKLLTNWECESIPDIHNLDLDNETNPLVAEVIAFVCIRVRGHIANLERIEKN